MLSLSSIFVTRFNHIFLSLSPPAFSFHMPALIFNLLHVYYFMHQLFALFGLPLSLSLELSTFYSISHIEHSDHRRPLTAYQQLHTIPNFIKCSDSSLHNSFDSKHAPFSSVVSSLFSGTLLSPSLSPFHQLQHATNLFMDVYKYIVWKAFLQPTNTLVQPKESSDDAIAFTLHHFVEIKYQMIV